MDFSDAMMLQSIHTYVSALKKETRSSFVSDTLNGLHDLLKNYWHTIDVYNHDLRFPTSFLLSRIEYCKNCIHSGNQLTESESYNVQILIKEVELYLERFFSDE